MEGWQARLPVHILQSGRDSHPRLGQNPAAVDFRPVPPAMGGDGLGYRETSQGLETDAHRHPPVDRQRAVDDFIHHRMEAVMDELKWAKLTEVYGRMDADLIESYLEAEGIDVELFQEAVGRQIYPTTMDGLAKVQIFVAKENLDEARKLIEHFNDQADSEN